MFPTHVLKRIVELVRTTEREEARLTSQREEACVLPLSPPPPLPEGADANQLSEYVTALNERIRNQKSRLAPKIKELRSMRGQYTHVENAYTQKKAESEQEEKARKAEEKRKATELASMQVEEWRRFLAEWGDEKQRVELRARFEKHALTHAAFAPAVRVYAMNRSDSALQHLKAKIGERLWRDEPADATLVEEVAAVCIARFDSTQAKPCQDPATIKMEGDAVVMACMDRITALEMTVSELKDEASRDRATIHELKQQIAVLHSRTAVE